MSIQSVVERETRGDTSGVRRGLLVIVGIAAGYALLHAGFRLLASHVLGEDDVIDIVLSQDLRVGYDFNPRQPPLYNWVLWAVQQVTGPRFESFLLIKYVALVVSAGFLYLAARRALGTVLFALLTVESLALIYSISWRYHEGFTHEVGAMVAVLATGWLILRILQDGRSLDFAWLGLVMGLGFLTEPAYIVFVFTLLAAAALQPAMRERLLRPELALSFVAALGIASPYLLWLLDEPHRLAWLWAIPNTPFQFNDDGFFQSLRGPIAYLSPLIFILPVMFPGWLKVAWADFRRSPFSCLEPDYELLVLHASLIAFATSIFGALVLQIEGLAVHVLMPLYLLSVIWLFGVAQRACQDPSHIKRFGWLAIGIAAFAFAARMANLYVMEPVCQTCRWGIPYEGLAQEMRARGFEGTGTIVSLEHELSGNLRQLFPEADLVARRFPRFTPEGADWTRGRVAYIWDPEILTPEQAQGFLKLVLPKGITTADAERVSVPWHSLWRETGYRSSVWYLLIVEKGRQQKRIINTGRERRLGL